MVQARGLGVSLLVGVLFVAPATATVPPALTPGWQARLAAMLPVPNQSATLMTWQPSISTVELQMRVARAGGSPEALQQVVVSAAKGVPPTYDERLGISREEFKTYLVFQSVLVSTGKTVKLAVIRDANKLLFGNAPGLNGILSGLSIDLKNGELRGPEGYSAKPSAIGPSPSAGRLLDVKSGFQWKLLGSDATTGNGIHGTLNLLQLVSGEIVLHYYRTSMIRREVNTGEIIVQYSR